MLHIIKIIFTAENSFVFFCYFFSLHNETDLTLTHLAQNQTKHVLPVSISPVTYFGNLNWLSQAEAFQRQSVRIPCLFTEWETKISICKCVILRPVSGHAMTVEQEKHKCFFSPQTAQRTTDRQYLDFCHDLESVQKVLCVTKHRITNLSLTFST